MIKITVTLCQHWEIIHKSQPPTNELVLASPPDARTDMIANRLNVTLTALEVEVTAEVDVRGTLIVDRGVPVGFQALTCQVHLNTVPGTDPSLAGKLMKAAEHSCLVLQTLRSGVPVETHYDLD